MPTFERDGVTLDYVDVGEGPALVLLHAYPLSSRLFEAQWRALSARYRVVVPDLRGFGKSLSSEHTLTMEAMALDTIALMRKLSLPEAVFAGVSMGGYVLFELLARQPDLVRGLALIDTQATADDEAGKKARADTVALIARDGLAGLADYMLPRLLGVVATEAQTALVRSWIVGNSPQGAMAAMRGMIARADHHATLSRFERPALVVVGEHDQVTPPERAQRMANALPRGRLEVLRGCGHLPPVQASDVLNGLLEDYLRSLA